MFGSLPPSNCESSNPKASIHCLDSFPPEKYFATKPRTTALSIFVGAADVAHRRERAIQQGVKFILDFGHPFP